MNTLINIDNGGTLTDICAWDGKSFTFTKTLTTPHDLSECLFNGLEGVSAALYGEPDLERVLHDTQHLRYSTTQGTNALVERKGPMIGILTSLPRLRDQLRSDDAQQQLYDDLVGDRTLTVSLDGDEQEVDQEIVRVVTNLTTLGAARIVVAGETANEERRIRRVLLQKFPRHLLGSVPLLYSWDLTADRDATRRVWSCVINSFLHPTMERFLYSAERRLRSYRVKNPMLVYRNDGASSRVAKAVALKTYSSGPRGGLEGTAAIARMYGLDHVVMMDIGGTTTDVGVVESAQVTADERGTVKGVPISYPMSNVHSKGVGGSSVIAVEDGRISVGPRSVGAAPGPACFGFGGKQATITDVNLLLGVLDADTYLDGTFRLDPERSRQVITETVAEPLGISLDDALIQMEHAYFAALAEAVADVVRPDSTLAAFGGAGPMSAAGAAQLAGVRTVLIPRTAAVFSAFGISFSDIGKSYEQVIGSVDQCALATARDELLQRAERDMFQEGYALADCVHTWNLAVHRPDGSTTHLRDIDVHVEQEITGPIADATLQLDVAASLSKPVLAADQEVQRHPARSTSTRAVRSAPDRVDQVPVYRLDDLAPGDGAAGAAIIEGPFFTARVMPDWSFHVTSAGDLILHDDAK